MFKTRYDFFKRIYKDYVLVFLIYGYYYVFYKDKIIISYFKDKAILDKLNEIHINYIILDNTEIIDRV